MELSDAVPASRGLASVSPCGGLIATAHGSVLQVRELQSMDLLHAAEAADALSVITWGRSSNGTEPWVAAASVRARAALVMEAISGEIVADIFVGDMGVAALSLSNAGFLLVFAQHALGVTVIDVGRAKQTAFLTYRHSVLSSNAHCWHPHGRFAAMLGDANDVFVVDAASGAVVACVEHIANISRPAGVRWTTPTAIFVWADAFDESGTHAVALLAPDGRVIHSGRAPRAHDTVYDVGDEEALGLQHVTISRDGRIIALCAHDGTIRVICATRWVELCVLHVSHPIFEASTPPTIFQERRRVHRRTASTLELITSSDAHIPLSTTASGIHLIALSADGSLLAVVGDATPHVILIWQRGRILAALLLLHPVSALHWSHAGSNVLIALSGGDQAFLWKRSGAAVLRIDDALAARKVRTSAATRAAGPALCRVVGLSDISAALVVDADAGAAVALYLL